MNQTSFEKIQELNRQIESEKQKISNCKHSFGKPFSNPETVREPYGYHLVWQGVDSWSEPTGYHDVEKPRWTQKCKLCGYEMHTNKTQPIISGHEPVF